MTDGYENTGMTRPGDGLGRVIVPVELRRMLGWEYGDRVIIGRDGNSVVLTKYEVACLFCGERKGLTGHMGHMVCPACVTALGDMAPQVGP